MADGAVTPSGTVPAATASGTKPPCDCDCRCEPLPPRYDLYWPPPQFHVPIDGEGILGPVAYPAHLIGRPLGFQIPTAPAAQRDEAHIALDGQVHQAPVSYELDPTAFVVPEMPRPAEAQRNVIIFD